MGCLAGWQAGCIFPILGNPTCLHASPATYIPPDLRILTHLPPLVPQELWCKKGPPTAEMIAQYVPQPTVPVSPPPPPLRPDLDKLSVLTGLADQVGLLLQNNHQVRAAARNQPPTPLPPALTAPPL